MTKFFHISKPNGEGSHQMQSEYFNAACQQREIKYERITEYDRDLTAYHQLVDEVKSSDAIVYRSARGVWAKSLERLLITDTTRTVYANNQSVLHAQSSSYEFMMRTGISVIPSLTLIPKKKRDVIAAAEYLEGFPLALKVQGGMEGVGVIRVDSIESFNSVLDFLRKDPNAEIRLMKYIPHKHYARVVVVGEQVVAATRDEAPLGDFRANARGPREVNTQPFDVSPEIENEAIKAVQSIGKITGGVDVLYAEDGNYYISEVNCPYNFAETQHFTGVDIAGAIVDELLK